MNGNQGWANALLLFHSFTLSLFRTLLFCSLLFALSLFALYQKSGQERFALSIIKLPNYQFTKRATKSKLLFCSFKKNAKERIALSLF